MRTPSWTHTAVLCLLLTTAGCRNNSMQPVASCNQSAPFTSLTGSTRVPAPATYSVNIPGASRPPYYNATAQLPPSSAAVNPPSLTSSSQPPGMVGGNSTMSTINYSTSADTPDTVPQTKTVALETPTSTLPPNRVAQNTASVTGLSYTNHTNFQSTAIDERQDQTRLPVTDASQVRAPTNFSPTATGAQGGYPYYAPPPQQVVPQYPYSPVTPPTSATGNPAGPNVVRGSFSQPVFAQPSQQSYSGVPAQGTSNTVPTATYPDPANDPNIQNGWSSGN